MVPQARSAGVALGVDLGTTNTICKVYDGGVSKELAICFERTIQPTGCVIKDECWSLPGEYSGLGDAHILAHAKRLLGRPQNDPNLLEDAKRILHAHVGNEGAYYLVNGKRVSPEEHLAYVLARVRRQAEHSYGAVGSIVIATPIAFTCLQQRAVLDAAQIAGFTDARVIPEPVAAIISYGSDGVRRGGSLINHIGGTTLVLDIGGGTADMCAVFVDITGDSPKYVVRATAGDLRLGGIDFDERLHNIMVRKKAEDSAWNPEDVKKFLSTRIQHRLSKRCVISRKEFEKECSDLLDRIRHLILSIVKLDPSFEKADRFLMVGGSTLMPAIMNVSQEVCPNMKIEQLQGATGIADGASFAASQPDMKIVDRLPRSIRICSWRIFSAKGKRLKTPPWECNEVISQLSSLPAEETITLQTHEEDQGEIIFRLVEGESPIPARNTEIGEYIMQIPPCAAETEVELTLKAFGSGLIKASAHCATTKDTWDVERPTRLSESKLREYQQATQARLDGDCEDHGEGETPDAPISNEPAEDAPAEDSSTRASSRSPLFSEPSPPEPAVFQAGRSSMVGLMVAAERSARIIRGAKDEETDSTRWDERTSRLKRQILAVQETRDAKRQKRKA